MCVCVCASVFFSGHLPIDGSEGISTNRDKWLGSSLYACDVPVDFRPEAISKLIYSVTIFVVLWHRWQ